MNYFVSKKIKIKEGVHSMFLRKKNLKFFLRRNIECTPSFT